jgi:hypothetical protein
MNMTKGWVKYLNDGSRIIGSDHNVDYENASWRSTSFDISSLLIKDDELEGTISGPGFYWQEDDYVVPVIPNSVQKGVRVARRIMRKITEEDKFFMGTNSLNSKHILFSSDVNLPTSQECYTVTPEMIGKWFVIEIDIPSRSMNHYLVSERT